ncbi:hypothetical protein [Streptomyces pseudovenezuelae]|uniref:DNA-directed RNA polymerase subunit RPC12/RpoP n=1 Tax=Streptomyces pseudovenezuelae TaxID=67350 RepID=A0ABT6LYL4_9ACTN|nr:hypothetical protein [Streptomyces pseudovenezuelae]MDH6221385.1 DNA-directed RNA polymerase subunit RPC12/RpoP [Streptomyces pseudovenezuelae]
MICPHCEKSLLRKERPGNVCSKCGRRYALDPKTNPLKLNDLRVRRIALGLTQDGQVPCTPGQLWYALSRKSLRDSGAEMGCAVALTVVGVIVGFVGLGSESGAIATLGGLLLLGAIGDVVAHVAGVGRGRPKLAREAFRTGPLAEWKSVYGALPDGVIEDGRYPTPMTPGPASTLTNSGRAPAPLTPAPSPDGIVLVCPDRSIAVFLDAAGLTARYGVTLVAEASALPAAPGRGPVLVLHDADAQGLLLAQRVRTAHPARQVVDLGLPLGAVQGLARAVPVRGEVPQARVLELLGESGELSPAQLKWLGKGWGFPLVGVPPAKLLAVVTRAVERAGTADDPVRRRAASVGFLTWPEEGR